MSGIMRSMKSACFRGIRILAYVLLFSLVFGAFFTYGGDEWMSLQGFVSDLPVYMLLFGCVCFLLWGMVDMVSYTQMTISFGATRREAWAGCLFMNLFEVAAMLLIMYLVCVLAPTEWMSLPPEVLLPLAQNVYLISAAMALISGVMVHRFGRKVYVIFALPTSLLCGGVAGFSASANTAEILGSMSLTIGGRFFALQFIGMGLFVIAAVISAWAMHRMEVRI